MASRRPEFEPVCPGCDYLLQGLEGQEVRCPECGRWVDLQRADVWRRRGEPRGVVWLRRLLGAAMLTLPAGVLVPAAGVWSSEARPWVSLSGAVVVALATGVVAWAGGRVERWEAGEASDGR